MWKKKIHKNLEIFQVKNPGAYSEIRRGGGKTDILCIGGHKMTVRGGTLDSHVPPSLSPDYKNV